MKITNFIHSFTFPRDNEMTKKTTEYKFTKSDVRTINKKNFSYFLRVYPIATLIHKSLKEIIMKRFYNIIKL